jgi:hypothetical protein
MPTAKQGVTAFALIALLHLAALLSVLAVLFSTGWQSEAFAVLPITILGSYVLQLAVVKQLRNEWIESPFFKSAVLAPFIGCVLALLIWWDEHRRTD